MGRSGKTTAGDGQGGAFYLNKNLTESGGGKGQVRKSKQTSPTSLGQNPTIPEFGILTDFESEALPIFPPPMAQVNKLLQRVTMQYKEGCPSHWTPRTLPSLGPKSDPSLWMRLTVVSAPGKFWELALALAPELHFCKDSSLNLCSAIDHDSRHC